MPGTFVFKPIEANLTHNTDLIGRMNPYCSFIVGSNRVKGSICKKGGKHPHWSDAVTIPVTNQSSIVVELMDKDKFTHDDNIGSFMIDLQEVESRGQISRWYPLTYKNKPAGEILMETVFQPSGNLGYGQTYGQTYGQEQILNQGNVYGSQQIGVATPTLVQEEIITTSQPTLVQEEVIATSVEPGFVHGGLATSGLTTSGQAGFVQGGSFTASTHPGFVQEEIISERSGFEAAGPHVFTEQRQFIEPHTFMKEVEVTETRPVLKQIEVMEPHKVLKDVTFTQAVPVHKQIEVTEPQVVLKEVEVIEPRLVTKEIQVVENVPVKRQVEVIENRTYLKEVDTFEPQTITKQIEVTEHHPVLKQVQVTEPVTMKKTVEFVEPVITTKTITKEIPQAVIVDERITQTVGPASIIGTEYLTQRFREFRITTEHERYYGDRAYLLQERYGLLGQQTLGSQEQERLRVLEQEILTFIKQERIRLQGLGNISSQDSERLRFLEQELLRLEEEIRFRSQAGHTHTSTFTTGQQGFQQGGIINQGFQQGGIVNQGFQQGGLINEPGLQQGVQPGLQQGFEGDRLSGYNSTSYHPSRFSQQQNKF